MVHSVSKFFENLKNKEIMVVGMGVSHFDLIKLLLSKGIKVTLSDKRTSDKLIECFGENYNTLVEMGVCLNLGENYEENLLNADVIFRTPGMYYNNEILTKARELGIVVTSEMETFFDLAPCKTFAVTGSDGKTTSTTLISEMLKAQGHTVHLGGNIGKALLPIIEDIKEDDIAVVELSSFQLISMTQSADVSVVTNVAPNHLDVHGTMEEYIESKTNIFIHQNAFSKTVLNLDNQITRDFAPLVRGSVSYFSRKEKPFNGAYLSEDGFLFRVCKGVEEKILHMSQIKLPGIHNVENYLTAISAVGNDVSTQNIISVAENFGGVEHRIELVKTINGVRYYNDSIATSPTRTIAGLNAFDQKLIVIAGGYDKKIPYEPLAPSIVDKVKILILLGATAPKIKKAVMECDGFEQSGLQIIEVATLEDAVAKAYEISKEGDVVTLSPASASFDLYLNFEQRGQHFKNIVNSL